MYGKKHNIYKVQCYLQVQPSTGGLGMYPSWVSSDDFLELEEALEII